MHETVSSTLQSLYIYICFSKHLMDTYSVLVCAEWYVGSCRYTVMLPCLEDAHREID